MFKPAAKEPKESMMEFESPVRRYPPAFNVPRIIPWLIGLLAGIHLFRLYGPDKTFFDKAWQLPDIEEAK